MKFYMNTSFASSFEAAAVAKFNEIMICEKVAAGDVRMRDSLPEPKDSGFWPHTCKYFSSNNRIPGIISFKTRR